MKTLKFIVALCAIGLCFASCNKDEDKGNASIEGRWEALRFADNPDDIAFVAIFVGETLALYVIPWGQHMVGTFTLTNGVINYNITGAYQASSVPVAYDDDGTMNTYSWYIGNLDATTLELTEGYNWYAIRGVEFERVQDDFGQFEFKISGNTATSSLVGIPDLVFHKI
jgi:hypothetical protein